MAFQKLLPSLNYPPVVVCVGSDLALGDSLGPLTGTLIKKQVRASNAYVYGTLRAPVTAKEVKYMNDFLRKTHPKSKIIAIDAAVGEDSELGLIKVTDLPLRPGSGAKKRLGKLGDISILGIVAKKSTFSYSMLNLTRLNMVYSMAEIIADSLSVFLTEQKRSVLSQKAI